MYKKKILKHDFFPYGTQYHRAPTPLPSEWAGDLKEIARQGYTHIQLRPQWRYHERLRGQCVWEDLDELFPLAQKNGLRVILKPQLETAPDWVFTELDGEKIGFYGIPIKPFALGACYVGGWWPCFDNPQVVEAASQFVTKLVERYHRHPALWLYDTWNEPVMRPIGQCQCRHSAESYRRWLKEHYGTIEELNEFFHKSWTSYDTLFPPSSGDDFVEMYLWRQWSTRAVADQVKFVAEAIRKVDRKAYTLVHTGLPNVAQDPACFSSDDMLNAQETDRYGTSFWIPLHPKTPLDFTCADFQSDWLRRVDPEYWLHEFYPNHADWVRPPTPQTLNRHIWMAIASGCTSFTFWQYRSERVGNETNGYGLREIDGSATPRSQVADGIAAILKKHGSRLMGAPRLPSRVAMLYSRDNDLLMRIGMMPWGLSDMRQVTDRLDYPYKQAIKGAHALYQLAGETTDWVVSGDDLSKVDVLHVTVTELIDEATAKWLKDFVKRGGKLVVEFPFANRDERTWVSPDRPQHGLHQLLGCSEGDRVRIAPDQPEKVQFTFGDRVDARGFKVSLKLKKGKAIAHWADGSVAAVEHSYGKGTVYALGVNLSLSFTDTWNDPIRRTWSRLLGSLGVQPTLTADDGVFVRRRRGKGREVWFVFNVSSSAGKVTLPGKPKNVWQAQDCRMENGILELPPGATWVAEF